MPYKLFKIIDGEGNSRVWRIVQLKIFFGRHYHKVQKFIDSATIGETYKYKGELTTSEPYTLERTQ